MVRLYLSNNLRFVSEVFSSYLNGVNVFVWVGEESKKDAMYSLRPVLAMKIAKKMT